MNHYTRTRDELTIDIRESIAAKGYAAVGIAARDRTLCILVDPRERQAAAQALAGDGYDVLPRPGTHVKAGTLIGRVGSTGNSTGPHLAYTQLPTDGRLPTINPADVKVGDVVEVEADDGSWLVRGEVNKINELDSDYALLIFVDRGDIQVEPRLTNATVRLVRRAEPEPDPEQVKALADALDAAEEQGDGLYDTAQLARELVRRGVTVQKGT